MAAYGLYSHIQSNKRRSIALLIGLFLLVYILVYAGALVGEALTVNAPIDVLARRALSDAIAAAAGGHARHGGPGSSSPTGFHQIDDRCAHWRARGHPPVEKPRLYNLLENLSASRAASTMPKPLKVADEPALNAFATGMNEKQYAMHGHLRVHGAARRRRGRIGARPRIDPYPQRRCAHAGVIAVIIAGAISFFAELVFRLMFQGGRALSDAAGDEGGADRGWRSSSPSRSSRSPGCCRW